jgi:hypothetical protein
MIKIHAFWRKIKAAKFYHRKSQMAIALIEQTRRRLFVRGQRKQKSSSRSTATAKARNPIRQANRQRWMYVSTVSAHRRLDAIPGMHHEGHLCPGLGDSSEKGDERGSAKNPPQTHQDHTDIDETKR